jgi:hypothetical protein
MKRSLASIGAAISISRKLDRYSSASFLSSASMDRRSSPRGKSGYSGSRRARVVSCRRCSTPIGSPSCNSSGASASASLAEIAADSVRLRVTVPVLPS